MRRPLVITTSALALAAAFCRAPDARADTRDPAAAEVLFNDGRAAMERSDYATACAKFRESERLDPAPGTTLNLANCEEKRGRLAAAWQLFIKVRDQLRPGDDRLSVAKDRAASLEQRVPRLIIRLGEGAPAGTTVKRDDVALGMASLGSALPVDPGTHTITVEAPGRKARRVTVTLDAGEKKEIEVLPGAEGEEGGGSGLRTAGFVVGGAGVVSLAIGVLTGVLTLGKKSTAEDNCPGKICNPTGWDAVQSGKTLGAVSAATVIIGLAAAGAGTAMIIVGGPKRAPDEATTALIPTFGPGGGMLSVSRTW